MDLKLLERFLSAMMPPIPAAKEAVNTAFECMKAHPMAAIPTVGLMIGQQQQKLYSSSEVEQVTAARGILTGIMIAYCTENPALRKYILEDYLERSAVLRGENIIDFFDKKAGRSCK